MSRRALALCAVLVAACGGSAEEADAPPVEKNTTTDDRPVVRFTDVTEASGLGTFRQANGRADKPTIVESFGAGVALFDLEGDGDLDVYLTNAGSKVEAGAVQDERDALFVNDGTGRFTDETQARGLGDRGWTTGVEVADVDGDGRLDLFLTSWGPNVLLLQQADGRFVDATERAGIAGDRWSTGACFLDVDRDGDLDLYVANHIDFDLASLTDESGDVRRETWMEREVYYGPHGLDGATDRLWRNRGGGTFEDVTAEFGVDAHALYGFEAVAFDADDDGWTDVYVANDSRPNLLWRNVEGKRFEELGILSGAALSADGGPQAGMGVAVGDADGDGLADLFVTNFSEDYYTFYRNRGKGRFDDVSPRARVVAVTRPYLGWSAGFDDLDTDGVLDLWCVNGHVFPQAEGLSRGRGYAQETLVFIGDGDGRFEVAKDAGDGLGVRAASRGGAAGDIDGDGDLDLVIGNLDGPPTVLRNDTNDATDRSVVIRLVGSAPNTSAHGAVVEGDANGELAVKRLVGTGAGFLSCVGPTVRIGMPKAGALENVRVRWTPDDVEEIGAIPGGSYVVVERGAGVTSRRELAAGAEEAR